MLTRLYAMSAIAALSLCIPDVASADAYCTNSRPPLKILTYQDGGVLLLTDWRGNYFQICNINQNWKGVSSSVCFAWMSKITSAINSGKGVGIWYNGVPSDFCKSVPVYGDAPAAAYIDVQN